jgi:glycosyltransferase involved in cell wall biosynthesis
MRVLHVIDSLGRGGAERVVVDLARASAGTADTWVAPLFDRGALELECAEAGIPLSPLRIGHRRNLLLGAARLSRVIRKLRPDVVQTHLLFSELYLALAPVRSGAVHLATFHNMGFDAFEPLPLRQRAVRVLEREALRWRFDGYVAVSERAADSARRHLGLAPIDVIPNPIDVDRVRAQAPESRQAARARLGIAADARVVTLVGKLSEPKGHDVALRALSLLPHSTRPEFIFVGDGPLKESLKALALELGVFARVRWVGETDRATALAWMRASDVAIVPSRHEGLPITLLEALAIETPVVATTVGGIPEVLTHEHTGLLIPPSNPEALANGIERLLADSGLASRLANAGLQHVRRSFGLDTIFRRYLALYERLLRTRTTHG